MRGRLYPGVSTSRSFGDYFAHRIGVKAEPEVGCIKLTKQNEYLIIACAAFWNILTPKEVFAFITNNSTQAMGEIS